MTTSHLAAEGEAAAGQEPAGGTDSSSTSVPPAGLTIVVHGHPAPQGSKRGRPIYKGRGAARVFTGKVAQVESSDKVKPWRDAVKAAALELIYADQHVGTPLSGPVHVNATFTFYRPKGHYRTGRNGHLLRAAAPHAPDVQPDLDKLIRSTGDALTDAGVYRDDSQVVELTARKVYAGTDHSDALDRPGAVIRITPLTTDQGATT